MRTRDVIALFLLPAAFACVSCRPRARERHATSGAGIVGGVDDMGDPAVIEVLVDGEGECTGTLVSPHVVLTAAHCITESSASAEFGVFTGWDDTQRPGGEVVAATQAVVNPAYNRRTDEGDMAVLVLERPLTIAPVAYMRVAMTNALVGLPVRMVGYGDNTVVDPTSGYGLRRQATSPLISFDAEWVLFGDLQYNQCYGDSGGPALMVIGGVETVVGVDSWQEHDDCDQFNYNTRIDTYAAFVDQYVLANDPPVGDAGVGADDAAAQDAGAPVAADAEPARDVSSADVSGADVPAIDSGTSGAPLPPDSGGVVPDADAGRRDATSSSSLDTVDDGCTCVTAERSEAGSRSPSESRSPAESESRSRSEYAGVLLALAAVLVLRGQRRRSQVCSTSA